MYNCLCIRASASLLCDISALINISSLTLNYYKSFAGNLIFHLWFVNIAFDTVVNYGNLRNCLTRIANWQAMFENLFPQTIRVKMKNANSNDRAWRIVTQRSVKLRAFVRERNILTRELRSTWRKISKFLVEDTEATSAIIGPVMHTITRRLVVVNVGTKKSR